MIIRGINGYFEPITTEIRDFGAVKTILPCSRGEGVSNHNIDLRNYKYFGGAIPPSRLRRESPCPFSMN
jgi:hypothetical protein